MPVRESGVRKLAVFLLACAAANLHAATVPGAIPGNFGVSETGAATYSIPLAVPPGTAGMEPRLSLNYSSQSGNGIAGVGWSLGGLTAITRCAQTIVHDGQTRGVQLDANDRFCLDGQRLVLTTGSSYGAVDAEYRTEIESFSKIVSVGGSAGDPQYFKAWTKAGQIVEFGNTEDARVEAQGKTLAASWAVNKISDTLGNTIVFTYTEDNPNGEHRIARIDYTGNETVGVSPHNAVEFEYETRPDPSSGFLAGSLSSQTQRLVRVQTLAQGAAVMDYLLAYETGTTTGRSRLTSLTQCAANGDCLNPTTFAWQEGEVGLDSTVSTGISSENFQYTHAMDVNGDGITDLIYPNGDSWKVRFGGAAGLGDEMNTMVSSAGYEYARPLDYDADGRGDLLVPYANGHWHLMRGTGDWVFPFDIPVDTGISDAGKAYYPQVLDLNGDGIPDLAQVISEKWHYTLGTGLRFAAQVINTNFNAINYVDYGRVGEFDGDGLRDLFIPGFERHIASLYNEPGLWQANDWHVLDTQNSGAALKLVDADTNRPQIIPGIHYSTPGLAWWSIRKNGHVTDFSGDGLSDLLTIQSQYQGNSSGDYYYNGYVYTPYWLACINKGGEFDDAGCVYLFPWSAEQILLPVDLNADGIPDHKVMDYTNNWSIDVFSTGNASPASLAVKYGDPANATEQGYKDNPLVGDFNGDGLQDLMLSDGNVWNYRGHKGAVPDLLLTLTDGHGAARSISYKPLTDPAVYTKGSGAAYPEQDLQAALYVVSETAADDGVGGQFRNAYRYEGARTHLTGRGFLGFRVLEQTDLQTGLVTRSEYSQTFPHIGQPLLVTRTSAGGVELARAENTLDSKLLNDGKTHFSFVAYSKEQGKDLNGAELPSTETWNTYGDDWGNLTQVISQTSDGFRTQTDNTYANDESKWHLGRLTRASVAHTANGQTLTRVSAFEYHPDTGLLTREIVEPDQPQLRLDTAYVHDAFGNRKTVTVSSPATGTAAITARTTTTTYDANGQFPVGLANALAHTESKSFDPRLGNVVSLTGPNNLTTTWQVDGFGRKTRETRADGTYSVWAYAFCDTSCPDQGAYRVLTEHFASDNTQAAPSSIAFYDRLNREARSAVQGFDGRWIYTDTVRDGRGNIDKLSRPFYGGDPVYWIDRDYDELNRLIKVVEPDDPAKAALTVSYNGLTISRTNRKGQTGSETLDSQGRKLSVTDALGNVTTYGYDPTGNLIRTTDPAGNSIVNVYDIRGRKTQTTDPDLGLWKYDYNALGEQVKQTDAKNQTTTFEYDLLGRLKKRTEPGLTSTWVWDTAANGKGKLKRASTNKGYTRTHFYDSVGRPSRTDTDTGEGFILTVTQSYDTAGRVRDVIYPNSLGIRTVYNAYGHASEVRNAANDALYWQLDAIDAEGHIVQETAGNGIVSQHTYRPENGRLTVRQAALGSTPVQALSYLYDTLGNVLVRSDDLDAVTDNNRYDKLNRLIEHAATVGGVRTVSTVTYDALGNLTSKTGVGNYSYGDPAHKHAVTAAGSNSYSYDANGNLTAGGGRTLSWTAWNMPASLTQGSVTSTWTYTAEHERYKLTTGGRTTWYLNPGVHQGGHYERTRYTSGTVEHRVTLYGGGAPIGEVLSFEDGSPDQTRYYHGDAQGSISVVTDEAGEILTKFRYDPWGKQTRVSGSNTGIDQTRQGHTGHEMLDGGLTHMNGRLYDPAIARFVSADPIVQAPYNLQSLNRYSYAWNNPLGYTDPSGYFLCFFGCEVSPSVGRALFTLGGIAFGAILGPAGPIFAGSTSWATTLVSGALAGGVGSFIATGNAQAAWQGALSGGLFAGAGLLGTELGGSFAANNGVGRALLHAAAGCISASAGGGSCGSGALTAGFTKFASAYIQIGEGSLGRLVTYAVIGGTAAEIGGGKFANGAFTGAFQYLVNEKVSKSMQKSASSNNNKSGVLDRVIRWIDKNVVYDVGVRGGVGVGGEYSLSASAEQLGRKAFDVNIGGGEAIGATVGAIAIVPVFDVGPDVDAPLRTSLSICGGVGVGGCVFINTLDRGVFSIDLGVGAIGGLSIQNTLGITKEGSVR
ncbi:MAG: hypothetical protein B7Y26_11320 [Hydrogenophilales bacterium 16-64-46]|nr:MAG: hypothetical protein B7Y26_11320 [Hydrogenophilales bacterium 16-64-46]OZA38429.1 MAG: hypothetical protein B7X87_08035 [Hydrogenophilales bacterium 17-64-34]